MWLISLPTKLVEPKKYALPESMPLQGYDIRELRLYVNAASDVATELSTLARFTITILGIVILNEGWIDNPIWPFTVIMGYVVGLYG
jgi:hypothetical protein